MNYQFDIDEAVKYGVDEAIVLSNIKFWIIKNSANNRHFYDGKHWTYNSCKAFELLFPFWNKAKIRRILKSLISQGAIIEGNFNLSKYDRTKWYAVTENSMLQNEHFHVTDLENGSCKNATPIPDSKPDSKPDIPPTPRGGELFNSETSPSSTDKSCGIDYEDFRARFNDATGKKTRVVDSKTKRQLKARIKEGYTIDEIMRAAKNACSAKNHIESGLRYITMEFITRGDKLEMYLASQKQGGVSKPMPRDMIGINWG